MKKIATVTSLVMMLGVGLGYAANDAQPAAGKQTLCPIMGGEVNPKLFEDADGKRVYFCCNGCPAEFKKDPAKYISKMEKDGIILEKVPPAEPAKPQAAPAQAAPPAPAKKDACCGSK